MPYYVIKRIGTERYYGPVEFTEDGVLRYGWTDRESATKFDTEASAQWNSRSIPATEIKEVSVAETQS